MESYPSGRVTNYGIKLLEEGVEPLITYVSPDNDLCFYVNGGLAPHPGVTEGVILEDGISGLHPTFNHLDHKGARQHGATWAGTVYDPAEMTMKILLTANTPSNLRTIIRKWQAAWDPTRRGTLSWVTHESGEWWCHPRLFRAIQDPLKSHRGGQQHFTWAIRNDDAFWQSHDSISQFVFNYRDHGDDFNRDDVNTLGTKWVQTYTGLGGGVCQSEPALNIFTPGRAVWTPSGTGQRTVVNRYNGTSPVSSTDNQVISLQIGDFFSFPFPDAAYIDIWGRMNTNDASPTGIRFRIGPQWIRLSRFNNGVETVLRQRPLLIPPLWHERWTLILGSETNSRQFTVLRSGFPIMLCTEQGTGSAVGPSYRGAGFGMEAGEGTSSQEVPPSVLDWSMGDNASVKQVGHLNVTNIGDQEEYPDLIVYGPGTFRFGNGPDVPATIEFGPLADGQVALIKTAPGQRAVYDITSDQSEQDLPVFQDFLKRLISLVFNGNVPPLVEWFQSLFGIQPEQGNLYQLLKGRWSRPVPPRPVSAPPVTSTIAVEIDNANAHSKVVCALTPRRRWPE